VSRGRVTDAALRRMADTFAVSYAATGCIEDALWAALQGHRIVLELARVETERELAILKADTARVQREAAELLEHARAGVQQATEAAMHDLRGEARRMFEAAQREMAAVVDTRTRQEALRTASESEKVLHAVAQFFGMTLRQMLRRGRASIQTRPRFVAMRILRRRGLSLPHIAKLLELTDHTSVSNGLERAAADQELCLAAEQIERRLEDARAQEGIAERAVVLACPDSSIFPTCEEMNT